MSFTKLTANLDIHQSLSNTPNASEGYTPAQIKFLYDKAANDIKSYINDVLINQLEATTLTSGAEQIGSKTIPGILGNTVYAQISNLLAIAQAAQAGTILPGTITDDMLSNAEGQIKSQIDVINQSKTDKNDYVANNVFATTAGTATAYTVTLNPAPTALVDGMQITILPHVDCGANPTLKINTLTALTIVKQDGSAIAAGEIKANKPLSLVRVGSNFFIRSSSPSFAAGETVLYENLNSNTYNYTTPTSVKEFKISPGGTIRVKYTFRSDVNNGLYSAYCRVYKNGTAIGILRQTQSTTPVAFSEDITFNAGDLIQIYAWTQNTNINPVISAVKICAADDKILFQVIK